MTDKQRISALETLRDSLLAKVMELEEINQRQARIIADMRAAEMKHNPHLKSVENGAGNSAVYQRDEDVLTNEQARVLAILSERDLEMHARQTRLAYQDNCRALRNVGMVTDIDNKFWHITDTGRHITDTGRAALVKHNAAQQTKNTI
jgi:hypothetical protein